MPKKNGTDIVQGGQIEPSNSIKLQLKEARAKLQKVLSTDPPKQFIKTKDNVQYVEIEYMQTMLDSVFQLWSFTPVDRGVMANSVFYEGLLTVKCPFTGDEFHRSGIGAVPIQLQKGAGPMQIDKINSTAIHKNLPAAKAYAFKNAVKSLGNFFGRNLDGEQDYPIAEVYTEESELGKLMRYAENQFIND